MVEVIGAFGDYANAPKKNPQEDQNMQGVPFVIYLSIAFVMGCRLLCDKAAVPMCSTFCIETKMSTDSKMEQVKVHEFDGDVKSEGMKYAVM